MQVSRFTGFASARWSRKLPVIAVLAYLVLLVVATHLPPSGMHRFSQHLPIREYLPDKLGHACAYAGLTMLVLLAWQVQRGRTWQDLARLESMLLIGLVIAVGGIVDEATQPLVGRTCDWRDWVANLCGIVGAFCATAYIARRRWLDWLVLGRTG